MPIPPIPSAPVSPTPTQLKGVAVANLWAWAKTAYATDGVLRLLLGEAQLGIDQFNATLARIEMLINHGTVTTTPAAVELEYYLSPTGSDTTGDGSSGNPWQTPAKARDAIRIATGRTVTGGVPVGSWLGATVWLNAGTYFLSSALTLDSRDSGTSAHPITYQPVSGSAILSGGRAAASGLWAHVTSADTVPWAQLPTATRARTWKLDTSSLGVSYGNAERGGLELITGGVRRNLAQWPTGATNWATFDSGINSTTFRDADSHLSGYDFTGQRPFSWSFPIVEYQDFRNRISSITGSGPRDVVHSSGFGGTPALSGNNGRYRIMNAIRDLSEDSTYVWCQDTQILYFLPAVDTAPTDAVVTVLDKVVDADAANYITFNGLTIEAARSRGVQAKGCTSFILDGCTVRNMGQNAVWMAGEETNTNVYGIIGNHCTTSGVRNCTLTNIGTSPFVVGSGDRVTLTDGQCFFSDNIVSNIGNIDINSSNIRTYGHGLTFDSNTFTDTNGKVIRFVQVSKMTVSNSSFTGCCRLEGDAGVLYAFGSHTMQECVINLNTFTDCGTAGATVPPHWVNSSWAVYLDDCTADFTVTNNTITNASAAIGCHAIQIAAGPRNTIQNNISTNCHSLVVSGTPVKNDETITFAGRGMVSGNYYGEGVMPVWKADMRHIDGTSQRVDQAPWSTAYPWLATALSTYTDSNYIQPLNSIATGNKSTTFPTTLPEHNNGTSKVGFQVSGGSAGYGAYFDLTQLNKDQAGSDVQLFYLERS